MISKKFKLLLILVIVIILAIAGFFYFQNRVYYSHGMAQASKNFIISKGEDAVAVGKKMEDERLISGKYYFIYYLWRKNLLNKLMAGEYEITPNLTIPEISLIITQGEKKSGQIKITFPEGWENKNIKARIENNGLKADDFDDLVKKPDYFRERYGYEILSDIAKEWIWKVIFFLTRLTGHLVLSTLHTNSAPETVTRLLDLGLDPRNFADALLGVLAQRLVRTLCAGCKQTYRASVREADELVDAYGPEMFPELGTSPDHIKIGRGAGCERCGGTGYRGRMGIHELLVATEGMKSLVGKRAQAKEIRRLALEEGMRTLRQDGIAKILQGHTDFHQLRQVVAK